MQSPTHALLYQDGQLQLDVDITDPRNLVRMLLFTYQEANISAWHAAVSEFRETVPELGEKLAALIETKRQTKYTNRHNLTGYATKTAIWVR